MCGGGRTDAGNSVMGQVSLAFPAPCGEPVERDDESSPLGGGGDSPSAENSSSPVHWYSRGGQW